MIKQSEAAQNLSSTTPAAADIRPALAPEETPFMALPLAANENTGPDDAAARLAAEALAREKARAERQRRRAAERRRWLLLLAFVLAVGSALLIFSQQVVRWLPGMATIYQKVGMNVSLPGYALKDVRLRWRQGAKGQELVIFGRVRNDTARTVSVPVISLELLDETGTTIYRWRLPHRRQMLPPAADARFLTRLGEVPQEAASVRITAMAPPPARQ